MNAPPFNENYVIGRTFPFVGLWVTMNYLSNTHVSCKTIHHFGDKEYLQFIAFLQSL